MNTRRVLVRYGAEVIPEPEEEGRFESIYITEKGYELLVMGLALQTLKRSLKKTECGEVYLASDLARKCHEKFLLIIEEDESFIPAGITLITLLSRPPIPEF